MYDTMRDLKVYRKKSIVFESNLEHKSRVNINQEKENENLRILLHIHATEFCTKTLKTIYHLV